MKKYMYWSIMLIALFILSSLYGEEGVSGAHNDRAAQNSAAASHPLVLKNLKDINPDDLKVSQLKDVLEALAVAEKTEFETREGYERRVLSEYKEKGIGGKDIYYLFENHNSNRVSFRYDAYKKGFEIYMPCSNQEDRFSFYDGAVLDEERASSERMTGETAFGVKGDYIALRVTRYGIRTPNAEDYGCSDEYPLLSVPPDEAQKLSPFLSVLYLVAVRGAPYGKERVDKATLDDPVEKDITSYVLPVDLKRVLVVNQSTRQILLDYDPVTKKGLRAARGAQMNLKKHSPKAASGIKWGDAPETLKP